MLKHFEYIWSLRQISEKLWDDVIMSLGTLEIIPTLKYLNFKHKKLWNWIFTINEKLCPANYYSYILVFSIVFDILVVPERMSVPVKLVAKVASVAGMEGDVRSLDVFQNVGFHARSFKAILEDRR